MGHARRRKCQPDGGKNIESHLGATDGGLPVFFPIHPASHDIAAVQQGRLPFMQMPGFRATPQGFEP